MHLLLGREGQGRPGAPFERPRAALGRLAPLLLVCGALALRLYGINWDQGFLFHPDERAILMKAHDLALPPLRELGLLLDADRSPWNPRWFPYGSFPLYLLKGVQLLVSPFSQLDVYELRFPARALSALADSLTVLAVYLLGAPLRKSYRPAGGGPDGPGGAPRAGEPLWRL
jgi:hypothetical protein